MGAVDDEKWRGGGNVGGADFEVRDWARAQLEE